MSASSVSAIAPPATTKYQLTSITEDRQRTAELRIDGRELPGTRPAVPALVAQHRVDSVSVAADPV